MSTKTPYEILAVRRALAHLLQWQKAHPKSTALNYAVMYARHGLDCQISSLHVQCLYVLSNMTHWRGEVAKRVRAELKQFTAD